MTKIVVISDTHNQLSLIKKDIPNCDILICCGDATYFGLPEELVKFNTQMGKIKTKHRLFIPVNHELSLDILHPKYSSSAFGYLTNMLTLINSNIEIEGLKIYTCSNGAKMPRWAFTNLEDEEKQSYYDTIPEGIDILVTHCPPYGVLDGQNWGCKILLEAVKRIQPKYLLCGHVHESQGIAFIGKTQVINAACLNEHYIYKNKPVIIEM